jgi:hypothetical protein
VIIWRLFVTCWISFWCFLYVIITWFIFKHEGLCWEFTVLGIIIETWILAKVLWQQ